MARHKTFLFSRKKAEKSISSFDDFLVCAERAAQNVMEGAHKQQKKGRGREFWQYREYHSSDSANRIDWRQSAKSQNLFVREHEQNLPALASIGISNLETMDFRSHLAPISKKECAVIFAMALALLHLRSGEKILNAAGSPSQDTDNLLHEIYENSHTNKEQINKGTPPPHCMQYTISDFLAPVEDISRELQKGDSSIRHSLIHTLDPAELTLPYNGRIAFSGYDDSHPVEVENADDLRHRYKERLNTHIEAIKNECTKMEWQYILHCTDTPIENTLQQIVSGSQIKAGSYA